MLVPFSGFWHLLNLPLGPFFHPIIPCFSRFQPVVGTKFLKVSNRHFNLCSAFLQASCFSDYCIILHLISLSWIMGYVYLPRAWFPCTHIGQENETELWETELWMDRCQHVGYEYWTQLSARTSAPNCWSLSPTSMQSVVWKCLINSVYKQTKSISTN